MRYLWLTLLPALAAAGHPSVTSLLPKKLQKTILQLPEDISSGVNKGEGKIGQKISNQIFDQLRDRELFKTNIFPDTPVSGSIGIRIGRGVYDNHAVDESFTVVDHLSIPASIGYSIPIGGQYLSLGFGAGGSLDVTNIRQVRGATPLMTEQKIKSFLEGQDLKERVDGVDSSDFIKIARQRVEEGQAQSTSGADITVNDE
jgi:hypothetical protein